MTECAFSNAATRYTSWLRDTALPFWRDRARDPKGGYFEALTRSGEPLTQRNRRTRVWSRLAYTFAHASHLGWDRDENHKASDYALASFRTYALDGNDISKGSAHLLGPDRSIVDSRRDAYDHAFLILGGVFRYRAFGKPEDLALARDTFEYLDQTMGCPDGSYREGDPATLPRRQNPHMHLFEAALALAQTTGDRSDLARCERLLALFQKHFFDADHGIIVEFFEADLTPMAGRAHLIEPGHMAEWSWLLDQYQALSGSDLSVTRDRLLTRAEELGYSHQTGFLADQVSLSPSEPVPVVHRTWCQTEYLKALIAQIRSGRDDAKSKAAKLIDDIFRAYIDPADAGGYEDQVDQKGNVLTAEWTTSTLYHLMSAGAELSTLMENP